MKIKINENHLRKLIRQELIREAEEDIDFDPEGLQLPAGLKKLLDPDISPAKYASLDAELDDSGSPAHQAVALVAFALSYADGDAGGASELLNKAKAMVPKIVKQMEAAGGEEPAEDEEEKPPKE